MLLNVLMKYSLKIHYSMRVHGKLKLLTSLSEIIGIKNVKMNVFNESDNQF